jgi:CRISPR-associated endonuclease Csn1
MIDAEFDTLWAKQTALTPSFFNEAARRPDCLLRNARSSPSSRAAALDPRRACPLALPSQQRFRIYQESNNRAS